MRNLLTLFGLAVVLAACGGGAVVTEGDDTEEQEALAGCVWGGSTLGWRCHFNGPCGALGGDYCYNGGGYPSGYGSLGPSSDCQLCLVRGEGDQPE